jgi:hypothetical protein
MNRGLNRKSPGEKMLAAVSQNPGAYCRFSTVPHLHGHVVADDDDDDDDESAFTFQVTLIPWIGLLGVMGTCRGRITPRGG